MMIKNELEFIDCLNYKLSRNIFYKFGFMKKNKGLDVIPNYFKPFKKENNEVLFPCILDYEYRIFKGNSYPR